MTSDLKIKPTNSVVTTQIIQFGGATYIRNYTDDSNFQDVTFDATNGPQFINRVGGKSTANSILHTGNKPTGSYVGNGDATTRTIDTGGLGSVICVWGAGSMHIVGSYGGIGLYGWVEEPGTKAYPSSKIMFRNGYLTIATDSSDFNANGVTYYYQVL